MTKRTLIGGLLVSLCLVLTSCGSQEDSTQTKRSVSNTSDQSKVNGPPRTTTAKPPIDWAGAKDLVTKVNDEFKAGKSSTSHQPVQPVADDIRRAQNLLGDVEQVADKCRDCDQETVDKTILASQLLAEILKSLSHKGNRKINELEPSVVLSIEEKLTNFNTAITAASTSYDNKIKPAASDTGTNANANTNSNSNPGTADERSAGSQWTDLIWPIAGGVAGAALIILAIFGAMRWRAGFWAKLDGHINDIVAAHVRGVKQRQDEFGKHLAVVGDEQTKTLGRLDLIGGEVQALGRRLRQGAFDSGFDQGAGRRDLNDYGQQEAKPVEPEFPASADEYLNKMKGSSIVVKPDFQNGILVNDTDGKGELVLIRDAGVPDEAQPLFVVPRLTQFQTKQEFHSYYERYYECQRPSAGDVWIIDPAIVSTVPGGWQLREKGVLEVR